MNQQSQQQARTEPRYVPAADVAQACGLSVMRLDNQLRPDDWASPRDFVYDGRQGMRYAVLSLYRLADHLQSVGEVDAALRLRSYVAGLSKPAPRSVDRRVKVRHVEATREELDRAAAGCARQHASDREFAQIDQEGAGHAL